MSSDENDLLLASANFIILHSLLKKKKKRPPRRRWRMKPSFKTRNIYNGNDLLSDVRKENETHFQNFCKMSFQTFNELLEMMTPMIVKQDTQLRKAIPARERLLITLHYLATGNSYSNLSYVFKISKQIVSRIIPEVCQAIVKVLNNYMKMPQTPNDWMKIASEFEQKWNFPHCVGSIDGKHIQIQAPINSKSNIFDYNSTLSIVLFAIVDANYNFIFADISCEDRKSDVGVFRNTQFFKQLEENTLQLPPPDNLSDREKKVPYVFVADDAFPLRENIMKPYSGLQQKDLIKRLYNYRICRAHRVVENVFGILSAVFRVLRRPMLLEPKKAQIVTMACIYLHNFLRKNESTRNTYNPPGTFDQEINGELIEGTWRQQHHEQGALHQLARVARKPTRSADDVRQEFAEYISTNDRDHGKKNTNRGVH